MEMTIGLLVTDIGIFSQNSLLFLYLNTDIFPILIVVGLFSSQFVFTKLLKNDDELML